MPSLDVDSDPSAIHKHPLKESLDTVRCQVRLNDSSTTRPLGHPTE